MNGVIGSRISCGFRALFMQEPHFPYTQTMNLRHDYYDYWNPSLRCVLDDFTVRTIVGHPLHQTSASVESLSLHSLACDSLRTRDGVFHWKKMGEAKPLTMLDLDPTQINKTDPQTRRTLLTTALYKRDAERVAT